jgi:hypothetical protein
MAETVDESDRIDLTELDVITRYSLAVRFGTADRGEIIEALRADLAWLESGRKAPARRTTSRSTARKTATRRAR